MTEFEWQDPGRLVDGELTLVLVSRRPAEPAKGYVPAYYFEMRRTGADTKVGYVELRVGDNFRLRTYGGHFAYAVDPQHRARRFAARACRLLLPLAQSHGLNELWITCNPDNVASRRTCEIAGADFVEIVDLPEDSDMYAEGERQKCRYRIGL